MPDVKNIYATPQQQQQQQQKSFSTIQEEQQHFSIRRVAGSRDDYKADIKGKCNEANTGTPLENLKKKHL
jgi:hypothetical protein